MKASDVPYSVANNLCRTLEATVMGGHNHVLWPVAFQKESGAAIWQHRKGEGTLCVRARQNTVAAQNTGKANQQQYHCGRQRDGCVGIGHEHEAIRGSGYRRH